MKKYYVILLILLASWLLSCVKEVTKSEKKPNVILIVTDDQGYGDMACLGNPWLKTPNLDALWGESTRLTDFHVSPTCSPTRAALMTGRYNNRTGVWHTVTGRSLLRENETTMAQIFQDNGYATGMFGKWHLGDNYPRRPMDIGFEKTVLHKGGAIGNTNDYWDNDYFDDYYVDNGKIKQFEGYCTDVWFEEAMKFIDTNKDKPFFCYIPTNAAHEPYYVEDKYSNSYKNDTSIVSPEFYGMIANIDENIGELRSYLKNQNLDKNTIIIYMTDNGTSGGILFEGHRYNDFHVKKGFNAGMRGRKASAYDGGHRVPFFIHWPEGGLDQGMDFDGLSAHIDILPTLLDMCKLDSIGKNKIDGSSLWPYFQDKKQWEKGNRTLIVDSQRKEEPEFYRGSSVMQKDWRLVYGSELYDMRTDPGQTIDVADVYPEKVKEMQEHYKEWYNDVFSDYKTKSYIHIGSDKVTEMVLSCHDWMNPNTQDKTKIIQDNGDYFVPYDQTIIRKGPLLNGYWDINVLTSGKYKIDLMRWPKEANKSIREGILASTVAIPGGEPFGAGIALDINKAQLKIQEFDKTINVTETMESAEFVVDLNKGKTSLHTCFAGPDDLSLGAYYVYINKIE